MSSKVAWIAMFVTMVFWLGQAGGCASGGEDQNYKILEEDRPMFEAPGGATEGPAAMTAVSTPPAAEAAPAADAAPAVGTVAQPASDTTPSVTSIDRSHWKPVRVSPDPGITHHQPHYFNDLEWGQYKPRPLDVNADPIESLPQALSGAESHPFAWRQGADVLVQPLKFAFDIVALPVYMVMTPPWKDVTTP